MHTDIHVHLKLPFVATQKQAKVLYISLMEMFMKRTFSGLGSERVCFHNASRGE